MADNLKEIFEEAGEFAEANNNKLTLADVNTTSFMFLLMAR